MRPRAFKERPYELEGDARFFYWGASKNSRARNRRNLFRHPAKWELPKKTFAEEELCEGFLLCLMKNLLAAEANSAQSLLGSYLSEYGEAPSTISINRGYTTFRW